MIFGALRRAVQLPCLLKAFIYAAKSLKFRLEERRRRFTTTVSNDTIGPMEEVSHGYLL